MDTRFLESFVVVAEHGSVAESARRLNLTGHHLLEACGGLRGGAVKSVADGPFGDRSRPSSSSRYFSDASRRVAALPRTRGGGAESRRQPHLGTRKRELLGARIDPLRHPNDLSASGAQLSPVLPAAVTQSRTRARS
jgi:hypothetical protein